MFNSPYTPNYYNNTYNQQSMNDRIDNQIAQLNQMKEQFNKPIQSQMPTSLTQNFQLTPANQGIMKYANNIDEVNREIVYSDTPFFSKDLSVLWIKNANGDIKSYEIKEIILKDEKDIQIEMLKAQINEMKGMIKNANANDEYADEPVESTKSTDVSNVRTSPKKSKQSTKDI